jgi:hypothetical protein
MSDKAQYTAVVSKTVVWILAKRTQLLRCSMRAIRQRLPGYRN